ncbi:MAG: CpXC domain-containing protein [Deltaproteobacteria bacterium]|nr:CpXC domain-containing protein [Deltaproteobacteria bacterium]
MSSFVVSTLTCPKCQREFEAGTAESLNVTRMPWAREQILAGHFHRVTCAHCGTESHLERDFLYTDLARGHFVMVHGTQEIGRWQELEERAAQTYHETLATGPSRAYELTARFALRVVFGLRGLADKLRVWDAGLDDGVVELVKLDLFQATPELRTRAELQLGVTAVDDEARRLEIEAWSLTGERPSTWYGASLARYHELAAARVELEERFPGLFNRPFVCWRRLANERVVGA